MEFKQCGDGCKTPEGEDPTVAEDEEEEDVGETPVDDDDIAR